MRLPRARFTVRGGMLAIAAGVVAVGSGIAAYRATSGWLARPWSKWGYTVWEVAYPVIVLPLVGVILPASLLGYGVLYVLGWGRRSRPGARVAGGPPEPK